MAEEVGAAYVSLIPSAKGFSRKAKAELTAAMRGVKDDPVTVPVKPEIDPVTSTLRTELQNQMRALARRIALELPVGADTTGLRSKLEAQLAAIRSTLSMQVPTEPGDMDGYQRRLRGLLDSTRVKQKVELDVDKDTDRNLISRSGGKATEAGSSIGRLFTSGFGSTLLNPLIGIPALILAAVTAPAVGALTAGLVLAGGGLAGILLGAFALRADEDLKKALLGLGASINAGLTEAAKPLKGPFLEAISIVGKAIKDIGPDVKAFFKTLAESGSIQELARGVGGFIRSFSETGALKKFAEAIGPALNQLGMALPDIGNALSQFLISISEVAPTATRVFGMTLRTIADIIRFTGDAIAWLTERFNDVGAAANWVKDRLNDALYGFLTLLLAIGGYGPAFEDLKGGIAQIGHDIAELWRSLWDTMSTKVSSTVAGTVGFVRGLPAQITAAVGNLGTLLFDAGRNVVQGLIDGIKSKLGSLASMASQMAGTIRNYLPSSPAKEGPLSGSGNPFNSGQSIAAMLAAGVQSELPAVATAAGELAGMFGAGSPGVGGASMRSMTPVVQIDGSGLPDALDEWLRRNVRVFSHDGSVEGYAGS